MADEKKLFKVTIDNITVEVEPGTSILDGGPEDRGGCSSAGDVLLHQAEGQWREVQDLPCRGRCGQHGRSRARCRSWWPVCRTNVMDGMVVKNITSEKVIDARNGVVEMSADQPSAGLSYL